MSSSAGRLYSHTRSTHIKITISCLIYYISIIIYSFSYSFVEIVMMMLMTLMKDLYSQMCRDTDAGAWIRLTCVQKGEFNKPCCNVCAFGLLYVLLIPCKKCTADINILCSVCECIDIVMFTSSSTLCGCTQLFSLTSELCHFSYMKEASASANVILLWLFCSW